MAGELGIEPARRQDARRIARMSRVLIEDGLAWRWTPGRIEERIRDPESEVIVARSGSGLAGFALMEFRFAVNEAHLVLLAVDPAEQRRGVGRALYAWLEKLARAGGVRTLRLEVRARNRGALAFYRELGFAEVDRVAGYYQGREDAVRMLARPRRAAGTARAPR